MAGIKVDPGWITGYANTVDQAADDLTAALSALSRTPLTSAAFGDVGKQVGAADAYNGASATLQQQVTRAAAALRSAAVNLRTIAKEHSSADEQQAAALHRAHRG
jgi:uncharacterized protein YukE